MSSQSIPLIPRQSARDIGGHSTYKTLDIFVVTNNLMYVPTNHMLRLAVFRRRSKKTSKLRVTGLCVGNSPGTSEFPAQMASNAENVSIWWRHHGYKPFSHISSILYTQHIWGPRRQKQACQTGTKNHTPQYSEGSDPHPCPRYQPLATRSSFNHDKA